MKVGMMSVRYPKGISVLSEDMARLIESKGHTVFFLSWPLSHRKPCLVTGDWRRDRVTIVDTFLRTTVKIEDEVIRGWVKNNQLDIVMTFEEPNNLNVFKICKELGVPTINYVDVERFNPDLKDQYSDCSLFFCPTQHCYDIMFQYGVSNIMLARYIANIYQYPWHPRKVKGPVEFTIHGGWGGVSGRKGVEPTIKAFVLAAHPHAKLTVVTQKRWKTFDEETRKLASKNTNIRISEINNTKTVYNADAYSFGHIVVQPSMWEGLGLTYIEAMCTGMPAITTNAPPMNEYVQHEKTGLLVDCDMVPGKDVDDKLRIQAAKVRVDKLAEAIIFIANNPNYIEYMSGETEKFRNKYAEYVESFGMLFTRLGKPL